MVTFSKTEKSAPAVEILPTLEVVVSIRRGDDPGPVCDLWGFLLDIVKDRALNVFDNFTTSSRLEAANDQHYHQALEALRQTCRGTDGKKPIVWSRKAFLDADHQDQIPSCGCSLTLGLIVSPDQPRGISFQVTMPQTEVGELADAAHRLAMSWPDLWRWISVGYRFIPVQWYSSLMPDALEIINGRSKRFRGVDVGDIFGLYSTIWQDNLRTVNWLTYVCDDLLKRIGSIEFHQTSYETIKLQKGTLFKTGKEPSLCDKNRMEPEKSFVDLDICLSKIRAERGLSFAPLWDKKQTTTWLNRFK